MAKKHHANYHSHTYLCGHAKGTPLDYVKEAIKKNIKIIGISEHAPMANLRNENSRLKEEEYQTYHKLLDEAKSYADKNEIEFYKGLEIEYFPHIKVYDKYLKDLDYLILGQHYILEDDGTYQSAFGFTNFDQVKRYAETIIKALKTNYFNMLCHLDLCFFNIKNPTNEMYEELRKVVKVAKKYNIPIELNANGIRRSVREEGRLDYSLFKYPKVKLFEIVKEEGADVIVTSDAHKKEFLVDDAVKEAYTFLDKLDIKPIYELNMKYYHK